MEINKSLKPAIKIKDLTMFSHNIVVLDNVTFSISPNTIHALMGPKKSGKTLVAKIIASRTNHDLGHVEVFGQDIRFVESRSLVGAVFEHGSFPSSRTVYEHLSSLRGTLSAHDLLDIMELSLQRNVNVTELSKLDLKKLMIASALVSNPKILILDEIANILNDDERKEMYRLVLKLKNRGLTIILVGENLFDAEDIVDEITVLYRGVLIHTGTTADFGKEKISLYVHTNDSVALGDFVQGYGFEVLSHDGSILEIQNLTRAEANEVLAKIQESNFALYSFRTNDVQAFYTDLIAQWDAANPTEVPYMNQMNNYNDPTQIVNLDKIAETSAHIPAHPAVTVDDSTKIIFTDIQPVEIAQPVQNVTDTIEVLKENNVQQDAPFIQHTTSVALEETTTIETPVQEATQEVQVAEQTIQEGTPEVQVTEQTTQEVVQEEVTVEEQVVQEEIKPEPQVSIADRFSQWANVQNEDDDATRVISNTPELQTEEISFGQMNQVTPVVVQVEETKVEESNEKVADAVQTQIDFDETLEIDVAPETEVQSTEMVELVIEQEVPQEQIDINEVLQSAEAEQTPTEDVNHFDAFTQSFVNTNTINLFDTEVIEAQNAEAESQADFSDEDNSNDVPLEVQNEQEEPQVDDYFISDNVNTKPLVIEEEAVEESKKTKKSTSRFGNWGQVSSDKGDLTHVIMNVDEIVKEKVKKEQEAEMHAEKPTKKRRLSAKDKKRILEEQIELEKQIQEKLEVQAQSFHITEMMPRDSSPSNNQYDAIVREMHLTNQRLTTEIALLSQKLNNQSTRETLNEVQYKEITKELSRLKEENARKEVLIEAVRREQADKFAENKIHELEKVISEITHAGVINNHPAAAHSHTVEQVSHANDTNELILKELHALREETAHNNAMNHHSSPAQQQHVEQPVQNNDTNELILKELQALREENARKDAVIEQIRRDQQYQLDVLAASKINEFEKTVASVPQNTSWIQKDENDKVQLLSKEIALLKEENAKKEILMENIRKEQREQIERLSAQKMQEFENTIAKLKAEQIQSQTQTFVPQFAQVPVQPVQNNNNEQFNALAREIAQLKEEHARKNSFIESMQKEQIDRTTTLKINELEGTLSKIAMEMQASNERLSKQLSSKIEEIKHSTEIKLEEVIHKTDSKLREVKYATEEKLSDISHEIKKPHNDTKSRFGNWARNANDEIDEELLTRVIMSITEKNVNAKKDEQKRAKEEEYDDEDDYERRRPSKSGLGSRFDSWVKTNNVDEEMLTRVLMNVTKNNLDNNNPKPDYSENMTMSKPQFVQPIAAPATPKPEVVVPQFNTQQTQTQNVQQPQTQNIQQTQEYKYEPLQTEEINNIMAQDMTQAVNVPQEATQEYNYSPLQTEEINTIMAQDMTQAINVQPQPQIQYDAYGNPVDPNAMYAQVDEYGNAIQYDANGNPIPYTPAQEPVQQYDAYGYPMKSDAMYAEVDQNGNPVQYDAYGNPIPYTPAPEPVQQYDAYGNPMKPNAMYAEVDQDGNPIQYDAYGNPIPYTPSSEVTQQYDVYGNPLNPNAMYAEVDQFGNPIKYDASGNPLPSNVAQAQVPKYDIYGNLMDPKAMYAKVDQNGNPVRFDASGNPITPNVAYAQSMSQASGLQHDVFGNPIDPNAQYIRVDQNGNPIPKEQPKPAREFPIEKPTEQLIPQSYESVAPVSPDLYIPKVQEQAEPLILAPLDPHELIVEKDEIPAVPREQKVHIDDIDETDYVDMAYVKVDESPIDVLESLDVEVNSEPLTVISDSQNAVRQTIDAPLEVEEQYLSYEAATDAYNRELERQQHLSTDEVPPQEFNYTPYVGWPSRRNSLFMQNLEKGLDEVPYLHNSHPKHNEDIIKSIGELDAAIVADIKQMNPFLEEVDAHDESTAMLTQQLIIKPKKDPSKEVKKTKHFLHFWPARRNSAFFLREEQFGRLSHTAEYRLADGEAPVQVDEWGYPIINNGQVRTVKIQSSMQNDPIDVTTTQLIKLKRK